ncbi:hypothetical protein GCM10027423_62270 [Spirosoma arcticum]
MNPKNRLTSSSSNLKPYPLVETPNGFQFTTYNGSLYEIYLGDGGDFFPGASLASLSVYIGFSRKIKPPEGVALSDQRIETTIKTALFELLEAESDLIIVFNYSSIGGKQIGRSELFKQWFNREQSGYVMQNHSLQSPNGPANLIGVILRADQVSRFTCC